MVELSNLVREIGGLNIPTNRSIVGDLLYQIESGIIVSWFKNCGKENELELTPFLAEMVGLKEPDIVIGKGSGIDTIGILIERLGLQASDEEKMALLMDVKEKAMELHRLLSMEEFKDLAGKG